MSEISQAVALYQALSSCYAYRGPCTRVTQGTSGRVSGIHWSRYDSPGGFAAWESANVVQLATYTENWIRENHVPFPKAGEPELTLMEEKALREEAERAVCQWLK
jgi:hypothetical protein